MAGGVAGAFLSPSTFKVVLLAGRVAGCGLQVHGVRSRDQGNGTDHGTDPRCNLFPMLARLCPRLVALSELGQLESG